MNMQQIRMQSQMGRIAIHHTEAKQTIEQPRAELSIKQPQAIIKMNTEKGRLTIDQSQAWADMNLMSITKLNKQHAAEGLKAAKQGAGRRASEGTALMKIEDGGNPLTQQAQTNSSRQMKPLGIDFIPSRFAVAINYEPAKIHTDITAQRPIIDVQTHQPVHHYEPGQVTTEMAQYPELEIDFV
ncbi:uncharacterized protein JNUCC1_02930 [Lentibacillus sp. JNUCC-1]|uniref:DUF6470 family protein n=1 Tax=Lentibacillus sp. JNUCC-1 TaxID=2654513 RepID=UPI0012E945BA|nr:DUF6470 family protein [Lentibacillus sp. JNUCC-1]MUV39058.1 uncharacterized protein [Lentibacillus sp. JNUCC-1]